MSTTEHDTRGLQEPPMEEWGDGPAAFEPGDRVVGAVELTSTDVELVFVSSDAPVDRGGKGGCQTRDAAADDDHVVTGRPGLHLVRAPASLRP